jgi:hypothetical protein
MLYYQLAVQQINGREWKTATLTLTLSFNISAGFLAVSCRVILIAKRLSFELGI